MATETTVYVCLTQPIPYSPWAGRVLAEYPSGAAATSPLRKYAYGSYIDEPLAMIDRTALGSTGAGTDETFYYHRNQQYSIAALSTSGGSITERYHYTPYGQTTITDAAGTTTRTTSDVGNTYTYTGRRLDGESGLHYFRARYLLAVFGRFVGRDPLHYLNGWNVYGRYAPVISLDPSGLTNQDDLGDDIGDDDDGDDDDDDDMGSLLGGPDWVDWGWALDWGLGSDDTIWIDGDLLDDFRGDSDVEEAVGNISDNALSSGPGNISCEGERTETYPVSGRTKNTVQLQDTIYGLGNTHIYYSGSCSTPVLCEDCCDGSVITIGTRTSCSITFEIKDSWENPIGNKMDWAVSWWRDDGIPMRGFWRESFERTTPTGAECPE